MKSSPNASPVCIEPIPPVRYVRRAIGRLPLGDKRFDQFVVAGLHGDVDGPRGEVHRPHGMAAEHGGVADRDVVLEVRLPERDLAERPGAAPPDERRRLIEIALLSGLAGQLDEPELDLRMPANALDPTIGERVAHVVGDPPGDGDELVGSHRPGPRHRRLKQVSVVVQLVAPLQIAVALRLAGAPEHGVEVAVGLLRRGDHRRQLAEAALGIRRPAAADLPGHRLHQLVHVRVGEHHPLVIADDRAGGGMREVGRPAEPLHPAVAVRQRGLAVDLLAQRPFATGDLDLAKAERPQRATTRLDRKCRRRHFTAPVSSPDTK